MKNEALCRRYATIAWRLEKALPDWIFNCQTLSQASLANGTQGEGLGPLLVQQKAYESVLAFMKKVGLEYDGQK